MMTNYDTTFSPCWPGSAQLMAAVVVLACSGCPPTPLSQEEQRRAVTSHWITVESKAPSSESEPRLDQDDLNEITQTVPNISSVVVERVKTGRIVSEDAEVEAKVCGTAPEYLRLLKEGARIDLREGRFLEPIEAAEGSAVVVLSQTLAKKLFPDTAPVGQSVILEKRQLTVVGVVTEGAAWGIGVKRDAYVPLRLFGPGVDQRSPFPYDRFRFRVESLDEVKQTHKIIQAIVERRHPDQSVRVRQFLSDNN